MVASATLQISARAAFAARPKHDVLGGLLVREPL